MSNDPGFLASTVFSFMAIRRFNVHQWLKAEFGTNDKTAVEIDAFLTEYFGTQDEITFEDFLSVAMTLYCHPERAELRRLINEDKGV